MQTFLLFLDVWVEVVGVMEKQENGDGAIRKDKWVFLAMTQGPVKSLLSQTLINHHSKGY